MVFECSGPPVPTDSKRWICNGSGSADSEGCLGAAAHALCRGGPYGTDQLPGAVCNLHRLLLENGTLWKTRPIVGSRLSGWLIHRPGGGEQLVVGALSIWSDGMAVARNDLWQFSCDA